jgi:hypothetical protein
MPQLPEAWGLPEQAPMRQGRTTRKSVQILAGEYSLRSQTHIRTRSWIPELIPYQGVGSQNRNTTPLPQRPVIHATLCLLAAQSDRLSPLLEKSPKTANCRTRNTPQLDKTSSQTRSTTTVVTLHWLAPVLQQPQVCTPASETLNQHPGQRHPRSDPTVATLLTSLTQGYNPTLSYKSTITLLQRLRIPPLRL